MSYIRPNSIYEPSYPAAHNKAYTDDPLDPVYHYTTYMGDIDSRSFSSEYIKPKNELPKYTYKKPSKNRRKQVAIASILFILFFLAIVATCILFIYFLVNEDKVIETKAPPLAGGILVDAELSLDQQFLVQYDYPTTQEYQDLENEFKKAMDEIMLASNYSSTYAGTTVLDFRNGSTIVGFNLNFNDIPTHLDNEVGSKEFSDEIQQDIVGVINNAHPNSTLISDLNAKEESLVVNDVREMDLPVVTTSKPITNKPSSTTQRPTSKTTTSIDVPSERTITIPEIYSTTKTVSTQEATTKSETTSLGPEITTRIELIETTESTVKLTTNELTSMQRLTTDSSDAQTTDIHTTIVIESTTEQIIDPTTTIQQQTTAESTTIFDVDTTIATTLQTTEKATTPSELTTEHLSTEVTTEQLTTEVPAEQLTTLLTTEQYTTLSATTEQDNSPIGLLTEFPANSSASIHVFGSMVLNESYPETLNNNSSNDYQDLVKALRIGIDCSVMHTELEAVYAGNDITEFKPGSIIIMFTIYLTSVPTGYHNESNRLSTSEYISNIVQYVLTEGITRGIFGNLDIIKDSVTVIQVTNSVADTPVCQDITSTCCRNLPYSTAVFPNSFAESQNEAEEILNTFSGACHTDAALYLCSKVYPACPSNVTSPLLPCRSFCEDVVADNGQSLTDTVPDSQVTNCTYLEEPSQEKPCFSSDGQVITRPSAAYNEEICSIRPLYPPPSARIVGGQDASSGEWPWIISLQRFTSHQCGAVLIAPQYALTAAHCLGLFNILELGTISLSSSLSPGEQRIGIETTYAHPEYDPLTLLNDIAIIKLEKQVDYTDYVRPICISTNASQFQEGESCYIAGWGDTTGNGKLPDILQEVSVPLVDNNACAARYASIGITVDESVVCAGYPEGGKDSCQGDSGGPLVCRNTAGLWYLFGIVSNGVECALPNSPGVYTRVPFYMDFINLVLGGGTPMYRPCTDEEFQCSNGPCINKDWQCDGHNDCRDNSDELMCGCSDDEFTCDMGDCVYDAWVCDGDYDCLDGSDEKNCGCLSNQFDCGDGVCIVLSYFCDGINDCRNGADEISCTTDGPAVCSDNEFMCGDGVCIRGNYQCDDDLDCMDGSDEENCEEPTEPPLLPAQCYNVTSEICGDILISNRALFPNAFARTPEDAEELMERFNEESDCHQDSIRLMCSFVYQGCEGNDQVPVHPCYSMCQSVIGTCAEAFQAVTQENNIFDISCSSLPDTHCLAAPGYCDGFLCNNNHCIEESYRCDSYIDCYDESDEAVSSCDMTEQPSYLCHPLNTTSCSDYLPYTYAAFPNDYAQTVEIADQAIKRLIGSDDCHDDMFLLMCNLLFPECDGYQYEPCKEHCVDVTESCESEFLILRNELNYTSPITCDDLPETNCLSSDGLCSDGDFQCDDGKCIPFDLTCDSHGDCLDYSDESNCSCTDEQYICSDTGSCLASYQVCDGFDNCPNGEDEIPCDNGCPGNFFRCANETSCIPLVYVCDGYDDCEQFNDEEGCTCGQFEFQCKDDGYCLPNYYVCDDYNDCTDGSDEMQCGK